MRVLSPLLFVIILVSAGVACSSGDADGSSGGGACAADARKDVYAAGLSKGAGGLSVRIASATPAPPAKGLNQVMLELTDGAGAPVEHATITLTPFMPDHGHGSPVAPVVTAAGGGRYGVEDVYLPMAGLWTLTVKVETAGAAPREAVFSFCLDG